MKKIIPHRGTCEYFIENGYDFAATSFHILTANGIRGRHKTADG